MGIHAGLFARIKVANIYVQPEALFSFSGGNVTFTDVSTSTEEVAEYEFKKIDIPVMVGLSFLKVARVNAGPVFSAMLDAKQIVASQEIDFTDAYNNLTVGFQAGVGADLWKIIVDLKYEGNLSRLGDDVDTFGFQTDQRNNQFVLSVGFKII